MIQRIMFLLIIYLSFLLKIAVAVLQESNNSESKFHHKVVDFRHSASNDATTSSRNYFSTTVSYGEGHPLCAFLDDRGYTIEQFGGESCSTNLQQKNR